MQRLLVTAFALGLSLPAIAGYDFSAADAAYQNRENNREKISESRAAYLVALDAKNSDGTPALTAKETIKAVEALANLAIYEADMVLPDSVADDEANKALRKEKIAIYQVAVDNIDRIAVEKVGKNPQYYYYRAAVFSLLGKVQGVSADSLEKIGAIKKLREAAHAENPEYDKFAGGGLDRVWGAIQYILYEQLGAGSITEAVKLLSAARDSQAYPEGENTDTETGRDYYSNTQFLAEAYMAWATKAKDDSKWDLAADALTDALDRIADDADLPPGRVPETKVVRERLKRLLKMVAEHKSLRI